MRRPVGGQAGFSAYVIVPSVIWMSGEPEPAQEYGEVRSLCRSRPRDGDGKWLVSIPRP